MLPYHYIKQANLLMLSLFYPTADRLRLVQQMASSAFVLHYIPDKIYSIENASSTLSAFSSGC